jgi:hypothetical protein
VILGDSITEQPFAPVATVPHWLTPARSCITSFTDNIYLPVYSILVAMLLTAVVYVLL